MGQLARASLTFHLIIANTVFVSYFNWSKRELKPKKEFADFLRAPSVPFLIHESHSQAGFVRFSETHFQVRLGKQQ